MFKDKRTIEQLIAEAIRSAELELFEETLLAEGAAGRCDTLRKRIERLRKDQHQLAKNHTEEL